MNKLRLTGRLYYDAAYNRISIGDYVCSIGDRIKLKSVGKRKTVRRYCVFDYDFDKQKWLLIDEENGGYCSYINKIATISLDC